MFLRKAWSLCSEEVYVLQEQQSLYNKLVNMSCATSMGVYYRNITRADRWGQEEPCSMHTWADRRAVSMHHRSTPSSSWNHAPFLSLSTHHQPGAGWFCGTNRKGTQKKPRILFSFLCLPPQGQRDRSGHQRWAVSREVTELSLCCSSTGTKSCRWQQCPFHALHCTHIPWFAPGRGQNPYLPLEISLETWRDEWERERERDSKTSWHLNLSIKSAKTNSLGFLLHHSPVILFQSFCPLSFCTFCNSLLCTCCLTEHHR